MPKRCPKCKTLNSSTALRCEHPDCKHEFSESSGIPQPPALAALATPEARVAELQGEVQQREQEITKVRALVAQLEKDAASRQAEIDRMKGVAGQPSPAGATSGVPPTTPAWMAGALALLARWPKASTAAAGIMALGTTYGGWTTVRNFIAPSPPPQTQGPQTPAGSETPAPAPAPAPEAGRGSAPSAAPPELSPTVAAPSAESLAKEKALEKRERAADVHESDLKKRESDFTSRENEFAKRQLSVEKREGDVKVREDAASKLARVPPKVEARMGYFDFVVPSTKNDDLPVNRSDMQGDGSTWPTRECIIVAVSPYDRDDRATSFPGLCTAERIFIKRPRGFETNHFARIVWLLK